jgi:hypothetical protein
MVLERLRHYGLVYMVKKLLSPQKEEYFLIIWETTRCSTELVSLKRSLLILRICNKVSVKYLVTIPTTGLDLVKSLLEVNSWKRTRDPKCNYPVDSRIKLCHYGEQHIGTLQSSWVRFGIRNNLYKSKVKQSRYTPWRRLGGEEV